MIMNELKVKQIDDKVLVVLSGGLDSSVAAMMLVDQYGQDNVSAVTFDYNQKQVNQSQKMLVYTPSQFSILYYKASHASLPQFLLSSH